MLIESAKQIRADGAIGAIQLAQSGDAAALVRGAGLPYVKYRGPVLTVGQDREPDHVHPDWIL